MLEQAIFIFMGLLVVSLVAAAVRLVVGPTTFDRVVALDVVVLHGAGLIALYAIVARQPVALDVLIGLALVGFVVTVSVARSLKRGGR